MLVAGELLSDVGALDGFQASLRLDLAGIGFRLGASAPAPDAWAALRQRYEGFVVAEGDGPAVELALRATSRFATTLDRGVGASVSLAGAELRLDGAVRAAYDGAARRGWVDADGVGAVDAIVRLALWRELAGGDGLLLHAALVLDAGRATVIAGASGAGKSTLARALAAPCDELVALRRLDSGWHAWSTPYWGTTPCRAPLARVVLLARAGEGVTPSWRGLHGADAVRRLWPQLTRFVAPPALEAAQLARLAQLAREVELVEAVCPSGEAFVPFVRAQRLIAGAA